MQSLLLQHEATSHHKCSALRVLGDLFFFFLFLAHVQVLSPPRAIVWPLKPVGNFILAQTPWTCVQLLSKRSQSRGSVLINSWESFTCLFDRGFWSLSFSAIQAGSTPQAKFPLCYCAGKSCLAPLLFLTTDKSLLGVTGRL